jgi:hypothetical protein
MPSKIVVASSDPVSPFNYAKTIVHFRAHHFGQLLEAVARGSEAATEDLIQHLTNVRGNERKGTVGPLFWLQIQKHEFNNSA